MKEFFLIAAIFALAAFGGYHSHRENPRLIGHECLGAGGDIWAMEESDFPTMCQSIEEY